MQYRHVQSLTQGDISLVAVASSTLAGINEGSCWSGPSPLIGELLNEFDKVLAAASGSIILDIRDMPCLDHASVSVLFRLAKRLADAKKRGVICCSSDVKEILEVCRLNAVCPIVINVKEAMALLSGSE